ncbi:MAG: hypothetical protein CSA81_08195 [Acidobacteria bacterium]|nr:MAG: hypothetical protein CSA81_08195 [Acidobacteriota bacterium]PIE89705.1 MAG: hypothetical protein CR997_09730 [Acidobacteriota bacterium]
MEKKQLTNALYAAIDQPEQLSEEFIEKLLEKPRDRNMGDWAFPCFQLARVMRQAPQQIASELVQRLNLVLREYSYIESVQAAGPYLNFTISKAALAEQIIPAMLSGSALDNRSQTKQRVMIEYSQPNTHKAFHVGHMRNVALGDALVRIVEWSGDDVVAANYIGDVGAHIAKCLWYLKEHYKGEIPTENRGEFLGEMYRCATELLDFNTLTKCPMPGVITAKVVSVHPIEHHLKQVVLSTGTHEKTVVCGGKDYRTGDVVAYAGPGSKVKGRLVQEKTAHGMLSQGMICSEKELGLSDDNDKIYTFRPTQEPGCEIAEVMRKEDSLPASTSVLQTMEERTRGVSNILKQLESKDPDTIKLWQETKSWSMDAFHEIYHWLNARFDHYFYESEVGDEGKELVYEFKQKGLFIESEGTIGADLSGDKLPFFMLLKSDGTGLYSTKDLALAKRKFEDFKINHSIYVVDASQSLHFQQVFATLKQMGFQQANDCHHLAYGLVVIPGGKMSSRAGNIIPFSELRKRLDEKIKREFLDKYRGSWTEEEIEQASRFISIATIRYGMLNCDQIKNIVFDLDEWTSKSGNTGPYLLYAYARIASLLRNAKINEWTGKPQWSLLQTEEEKALVSLLSEFEKTILKAAEDYRPQLVCIYLYDLAKSFSRMWDKIAILKAETTELKVTRLQLAKATGMALKKGLELLGIQTLERM